MESGYKDHKPTRPSQEERPISTLLEDATRHAKQAGAMANLVHKSLFPDLQNPVREDDLGLMSSMADSLVEQMCEALDRDIIWRMTDQRIMADIFKDDALPMLLYARALEWRMCRQLRDIGMADPDLPPVIDRAIASQRPGPGEAAMGVLATQSRFLSNARAFRLDISEFPAEDMYRLVSNCQSAMLDHSDVAPIVLRSRAEAYMARFDEGYGRPRRLAHMAHLLVHDGDETGLFSSNDLDIVQLGFSLTMAILAVKSRISRNRLILMTLDQGLPRLAVILRSMDMDTAMVMKCLADLATLSGQHMSALADPKYYATLTAEQARQLVARWAAMDAAHGRTVFQAISQPVSGDRADNDAERADKGPD